MDKNARQRVYDKQDLRSFLNEYEAGHPEQVVRIAEEVALDYESVALAFELEARKKSPLLIFENVKGSRFPVLMNLFGSRDRFAAALGVETSQLLETWAAIDSKPLKPQVLETGPVKDVVLTGDDVDLGYLPIMRNFVEDGGPYLTNAMFISKDPETGVRNASFHRLQVNGKNPFRHEPAQPAASVELLAAQGRRRWA